MLQLSEFIMMVKYNPKIEFYVKEDQLQIIARWCIDGQDYGKVHFFSIKALSSSNIDVVDNLANIFNHGIDSCLNLGTGK